MNRRLPGSLLLFLIAATPTTVSGQPAGERVLVQLVSAAPGMDRASRSPAALSNRFGVPGVSFLPGEQESETRLAREDSGMPGGLPVEDSLQRAARRRAHGLDRWISVTLPPGESAAAGALRLGTDPIVERAEPDYTGRAALAIPYIPTDPLFAQQWYLSEAGDHDIDMPEAWDLVRSAAQVPVAVLDSGASLGHPDLRDALMLAYARDFVSGDDDPSDDAGHGTHVTGLIAAAADDGIGIAGGAFRSLVVPLKVLGADLSGSYSWWGEAIVWAADIGVRVINISAAGSSDSAFLHDAVRYAHDRGVVICAAMFNDNTSDPYYPAAFAETIAVGATDMLDRRADPFTGALGSGSNWGAHIDLVAPGDEILSTYPPSGYATSSGTSQATPLVSAVAALLIAADSRLQPEEVRSLLHAGAQDLVGRPGEDTAGFDPYHGYGRLNAYASLLLVDPPPAVPLVAGPPPRPNPSRGLVRFPLQVVNQPAPVSLRIYDVRGRLIRTVTDRETRDPGVREEVWDGLDRSGRPVPSGPYLWELWVGTVRRTGRILIVR